MKKKAFTLTEVLVSSLSVSLIMIICLALMRTSSLTLTGEFINSDNRRAIEENVSYITREIQSAEKMSIEDNGKVLRIRKVGTSEGDTGASSDRYTIKYEIKDGDPCGGLYITSGGGSEKKLMDVDYENSNFSGNKDSIDINFTSDETCIRSTGQSMPGTRYIKHYSRLGATNSRLSMSRLQIPAGCYMIIFDSHALDNYGGLEGLMSNRRKVGTRFVNSFAYYGDPSDSHYQYTSAEIARYTNCNLSNVTLNLNSDDIVIMFYSKAMGDCNFSIDKMLFDSDNGIGNNTVNIDLKTVKDPRNFPLQYSDFKLSVSSRNKDCEVQ